MRIVVQRVTHARVSWPEGAVEHAATGLLCLVGFRQGDGAALLEPMAEKLLHLRVFEDESGRLNRSLSELGGGLVLVPQFTLYADCRKGRRPSFTDALPPGPARGLFHAFAETCEERARPARVAVQAGQFGAHMQVRLLNDGPVTILLDSHELGLHGPSPA